MVILDLKLEFKMKMDCDKGPNENIRIEVTKM